MDHRAGPYTDIEASITDADAVVKAMEGVDAVLHTATLHKPQVAFRSRADFVDVNIHGTLALLEAARANGVMRFVYTSTTSTFGDALEPVPGAPAVWIDEDVVPVPKNIYGATKCAAEDLCALFARNEGMATTVLRTSRFFPEDDDSAAARQSFSGENLKANEYLHRRVDVADVASAHICALERETPGFARYVISAPPPFSRADLPRLPGDAAGVIADLFPEAPGIYKRAGFILPDRIGRVYSSHRALAELGWSPVYTYARVLQQIAAGEPIGSDLVQQIGIKGYETSSYGKGDFPDEA